MIKKLLATLVISSVLSVTLVTCTTTTNATEESEPYTMKRMDKQLGKDIYVLTDNETNLEYLVIERYESNNGTTTLSMTPRYETTPTGHIQIKGWNR
nr:hypothetical protein [Clostridioides sp.]